MHRAYRGTMCSENWRCFRGSINYATIPGLDRGLRENGKYDHIRHVCMTTCMCVCMRVPGDRSLRHTVPRSHWHRESPWSSIGCPCDFRLTADLRIAPRERQFASHSDSQRKTQTACVLEIIREYSNVP